jgi:hypothetical protein
MARRQAGNGTASDSTRKRRRLDEGGELMARRGDGIYQSLPEQTRPTIELLVLNEGRR